jgi:transposase
MSRPGGWEGYEVEEDWDEVRGQQRWCVIRLSPIHGLRRCCSGRGRFSAARHHVQPRRVRDLPVFEHWVIVEPMRNRVLWVGRGREDIRPFFAPLGAQRCQALKAAVMDMNAGYEREVQAHCPYAAIVSDLFPVMAKYGRDLIDRVRVDRANELRAGCVPTP